MNRLGTALLYLGRLCRSILLNLSNRTAKDRLRFKLSNETRLDSSSQTGIVSIPGYNLERIDRNRHSGGVVLYITDTITCHYKRLTALPDDHLELIAIQVSKPKVKPVVVSTCYRPPRSTVDIINKFENVLHKLES